MLFVDYIMLLYLLLIIFTFQNLCVSLINFEFIEKKTRKSCAYIRYYSGHLDDFGSVLCLDHPVWFKLLRKRMKAETIENNYRLWIAIAYFTAFLCQIPLLIEHMPDYIGVDTSFNTYSPAVIMILFGCLLFIIDRIAPKCGDKFRLQLFSAILLSIGSAVWCICGVSWSSRLCNALFEDSLQRDQCWGSTFVNFFAISCMMLYLTISVIDDLFQPKARLITILFVNFMAFIHLILYLVVNSYGPHQMTTHLKFYY